MKHFVITVLVLIIAAVLAFVPGLCGAVVCVTPLSVLPLLFAALLLFCAFVVRDFGTEPSSAYPPPGCPGLSEQEQKRLAHCCTVGFICFVPLQLPFVFYCPGVVKVLASLVLCLVASACGPLMFRIRYGRAVKARLEREDRELRRQCRREETGEYK